MLRRLLSGLAFICATLAFADDASAGPLECLNAVTGVKSAYQVASEIADTEFLSCTQQMASGDVALIAVVSAVVGAGAAGAFHDRATCDNMTTGVVGQAVAAMLINSGPIADAIKAMIGKDGFLDLVKFASGTSTQSIAQVDALAPVFRYLTCGCSIYSKADAAAQIAKGWANDVKACAGFVADVGKAIGNLVESGIDGIGEFFEDLLGFGDSGPAVSHEMVFLSCGEWQIFPPGSTQYGSNYTSPTVSIAPYLTQSRQCTCQPPSKLEIDPLGDGWNHVRCGCSEPVNGTYYSKTTYNEHRTRYEIKSHCGCKPSERLVNGACISCNAEEFSETATSVSVSSGSMTNGQCKPVTQTCKAGERPVRAGSGYYYSCAPVCPSGSYYMKDPSATASDYSCQSCERNSVPVEASLGSAQLQCRQCAYDEVAGTGASQCVKLQCANGVDPANPHTCRQACRMMGEPGRQYLVCDGRAVDTSPVVECPAGMSRQDGICKPVTYHDPNRPIVRQGLEEMLVTPKRMEPILRNRTPREVVSEPSVRRQNPVRETRREQRREKGPTATQMQPERQAERDEWIRVGPAQERGPDMRDIGKALDLGIGIIQSLDRNGGGSGQSAMPSGEETVPATRAPVDVERRVRNPQGGAAYEGRARVPEATPGFVYGGKD